MRQISHLTPVYIYYKLKDIIYQKLHPTDPWLTPESIGILEKIIAKDHIGFEYGSGRSTIWFAKRTKYLTSVETSDIWYKKIKANLTSLAFSNVNLLYIPIDDSDGIDQNNYFFVSQNFLDNSLDYVLIDGRYRDQCLINFIPKIKLGGILIIDNVNRYVPSNSSSPGSIELGGDYYSELWSLIDKKLKTWHLIWTTNGVTDTAIFVKKSLS